MDFYLIGMDIGGAIIRSIYKICVKQITIAENVRDGSEIRIITLERDTAENAPDCTELPHNQRKDPKTINYLSMTKNNKEALLQKLILDYLRLHGYLAIKVNNGGVYIKKLDRYMKSPQRGISDILFWGHSIFGAIEVKVKPNKPTAEQEQFLADMRYRGGVALVAYSLDDISKII